MKRLIPALLPVLALIASFAPALMIAAPAASAQDSTPGALDFGAKETLLIKSEDGEHSFAVEVADTLELQARGMMFRNEVGANEGMIFEFETPKIATIWMKNTGIFLDILFVRENGRVLKIEHNAKPYSLRLSSSEAPVAAVIELRGGRARELGIEPGNIVVHEFFGTN